MSKKLKVGDLVRFKSPDDAMAAFSGSDYWGYAMKTAKKPILVVESVEEGGVRFEGYTALVETFRLVKWST